MVAEEFCFLVNQLVASFKDAHTNISLNIVKGYVNIPIEWLEDGIYVTQDTDLLQSGDKILSIGGKNEKELLDGLRNLRSSENDFWLKRVSKYFFCQSLYLEQLEIIEKDNIVMLDIERKGSLMTVEVPIVNDLYIQFDTPEDVINYHIEKDYSLGVLYINKSMYNEEFAQTLKDFFTDVADNDIQNIAIDLRNNSGGNTPYIRQLLSYIDIEQYYFASFETRFSVEMQNLLGYKKSSGYEESRKTLRTNEKVTDNVLFKGKVYVLVSPLTMSAANILALIIKDNNIGTLIGEPTGQRTHRYGDAPFFYLPNTGLRIQVSHKRIDRPDINAPVEDALYPDIMVQTTIDDVLNERDPQLMKLREIISSDI